MVQIPLDQMAKILIKEAISRKTAIMSIFTLITLTFLIMGLFWPKTYSSSTSIIANEKKIIRPLMQGNAVTTNLSDKIRIAKEIIFSRAIMNQVLTEGGWVGLSPVEQEHRIATIKGNTHIGRGGPNLIKISYTDSDPERAFRVTQKLAGLFIIESERSKREESSEAYDFIDKQVSIYHEKLMAAEKRLKDLREDNLDARPGSDATVNRRIADLRNQVRQSQLALKEAQIKKSSLESQLSGEVKVAKNISRINFYRQRIGELELSLDSLRLSYHETYPDIIQLKNQISELKVALEREEEIARSAGGYVGGSTANNASTVGTSSNNRTAAGSNPIYLELRSQLANTITEIATYRARINETQQFLQIEQDRLQRISDGEALLAELTRDYEVHQTIYQDLLHRREKARVSLHLQLEDQGLNFKVQEPANLPLTPNGLRFIYFAIMGPLIGLAVPIGLIYIMIMIDGKVRYERALVEQFDLPLFGHIPHINTPEEIRAERSSYIYCFIMLGTIAVAYAITGWLKLTGLL